MSNEKQSPKWKERIDELYSDNKTPTGEDIVAALVTALEELGVPTVKKKLFDAMTKEAAKYKMLYDALLTACAEQGFVPYAPKPPKE